MTAAGRLSCLSYTAAIKIPLLQRRFKPVSSACHLPVLVTKKGRKQSGVHRRGTGSREKEIGRGKTDRGLAFTAPLRGRFALCGVETGSRIGAFHKQAVDAQCTEGGAKPQAMSRTVRNELANHLTTRPTFRSTQRTR